jgi:para-aminobenzoate synthetase component 1
LRKSSAACSPLALTGTGAYYSVPMLHIEDIPWRPPSEAFRSFAGDPRLAWLDSAAVGDPRSRYSYLCPEPFSRITADGTSVWLNREQQAGDPFTVLAQQLARFSLPPGLAPVPFAGGAVGYLGYELGRWLERLPARHPATPGLPDMAIGFHDVILAFDGWEERCWLISSGFPERGVERETRARLRAAQIRGLLDGGGPVVASPPSLCWTPDSTRAEYEARVARVLDYIRAGDIFQANVTMAHRADRPPGLDPAALYLALRARSPTPFAAYFACDEVTLAGASPERFLKLDPAGRIETRPIKGTRPRRADPAADQAEANALLMSEKDRAENLMIVDLMRNDLGRVAEIGSVRVPELFALESFATVHHLVSAVEARLRPGLGPVDLLRGTFPGGSVTGAPKIRAMEIIDEVETSCRGPYCGAIAWIGFDGAMDSSITIRTLVVTADQIIAQAGGGIVADSDPASEYEEHWVKIRSLLATGGRPMILWLNGALLPAAEARIDPSDRGFSLGDGVFETICVRAGAPLHLPRHLARLQAGLALLGIPQPEVRFADAMQAVLMVNRLSDAVLRLTVSRGVAARGVLPQGPIVPTVLIAAGLLPAPLPAARLVIAQGTRRNECSPLSRIKSLNYLDNILARQEAAARCADDSLILNTQGFLAEATAANLFLWLEGKLVTPPLSDGALPGIARGLLIERGGAVERRLHPVDLARVEGGFLSNSLGLRPIASIEGRPLPVRASPIAALRA